MDTDLVKSREVAISDLNNTVSLKSGFEKEDIEYLTNLALTVLDHVRNNRG